MYELSKFGKDGLNILTSGRLVLGILLGLSCGYSRLAFGAHPVGLGRGAVHLPVLLLVTAEPRRQPANHGRKMLR